MPEMAMLMEAAVKARLNILISGAANTGKTTLLRVLAGFISVKDWTVQIQDASQQVKGNGNGLLKLKDSIRNRWGPLRPDHLIIDECGATEAHDLLHCMVAAPDNHVIATMQASSPRDALSHFEAMVLGEAGSTLDQPLPREIASCFPLIIHLELLPGGLRRVTHVSEVVEQGEGTLSTQDLFLYQVLGKDSSGRAYGQFSATGKAISKNDRIEKAGIRLPTNFFKKRILMRDGPHFLS